MQTGPETLCPAQPCLAPRHSRLGHCSSCLLSGAQLPVPRRWGLEGVGETPGAQGGRGCTLLRAPGPSSPTPTPTTLTASPGLNTQVSCFVPRLG